MRNRSGSSLIIACVIYGCASGLAQPAVSSPALVSPDSIATTGGVSVGIWREPRMVVVEVPDTLIFTYLPQNDAPLDSIARRDNLRGLANCSFFSGARGRARHAGWLSFYGRQVTPLMDDRQLTHIVRINGTKRSTKFVPARSFVSANDPETLEFQTGPLVVDSGRVREDLIRSSINGPTRHSRTLLATLDHRRCFFITVTDRVTLTELGKLLLRLNVFRGGVLDVVNLDGGSSVALYLRDVPAVNANVADRLPILIGFR